MEATETNDLSILFSNIDNIKNSGNINIYSLGINWRNKEKNFSIILPDNKNSEILKEICENLESYKEFPCKIFDPIEQEDETYAKLQYSSIKSNWETILSIKNNSSNFRDSESKKKVQKSNFSICILEYESMTYYLCSKQISTVKLFQGKSLFMSANDKLERYQIDNFFLFNNNIDFIVRKSNCYEVFILNRKNFISFFNYYEYLKEFVQKHSDDIREWKFLTSPDVILSKISQKNVYKNLSKVFENDEYLKQIREITPALLKRNLIKNCSDFTNADFAGDKLLVSEKNVSKIMKMLAKGFRFNFFTAEAER